MGFRNLEEKLENSVFQKPSLCNQIWVAVNYCQVIRRILVCIAGNKLTLLGRQPIINNCAGNIQCGTVVIR